MKRILTASIILIFLYFSFTTCEVGLGEQINLNGPVVEITSPSVGRGDANDPQVGIMFNLKGTVKSASKIASITVTLDWWNKTSLVTMGREYKYEDKDGSWKWRESKSGNWETYNEASYSKITIPNNIKINKPSWNKDTGEFNLPVNMYRMGAGVYFVRVKAYDIAGLHDSNSSKNVRFRYVNEAPNLDIVEPAFKFADGGSLSNPPPPNYSSYIFDPFGEPEATYNNIVSHFTNDIERFAWSIKTNSPFDTDPIDGGYKMYLALTNQADLDQVPIESPDRIKYWSWSREHVTTQNGVFCDGSILNPPKTIGESIYISGKGDFDIIDAPVSLTFPDGGNFTRNEVTPLQLVSRVEDKQGNQEYLSNGWLLYLPDSDLPYTDISFATKVKGDSKPPLNSLKKVQRNDNSSGIAYDDDGLLSLEWILKKYEDDSKVDDGDYIFTNNEKRQTWSFRASYGPGNYKIEVQVTDSKGTPGEWWYGYFTIASNSTPRYRSWDSSLSSPLFGGADGTFRIKGTAQIEDSDDLNYPTPGNSVKVDRVTIIWLKNPTDLESEFQYMDTEDPLWNGPATSDSKGNKKWEVPSGQITFLSSTDGNKNGNSQEDYEFYIDLNLFTDLAIGKGAGKNPFESQTFLVRYLSNGIGGNPLSSVTKLATVKDTVQPTIVIERVMVTYLGGGGLPTQFVPGVNQVDTIAAGDKVRIEGSWSDNSMGIWTDIPNRHIDLMSALTISWNGELKTFDFTVPSFTLSSPGANGGVWSTNDYEFTAYNEDPIVLLSAHLTDIAGNVRNVDQSIVITTDYPTFSRFSSTVNDGVYGPNKDTYPNNLTDPGIQHYIDIFMEFNKTVTMPNVSDPPILTLNNGKTATYEEGNGSSRILFRYTLESSDNDTDRLNVTGISWGGNNPYGSSKVDWHGTGDDATAVVVFPTAEISMTTGPASIPTSQSLYANKQIRIDKTSPTITGVKTTSSAGSYGRESTIYITASFSEEIRVTGDTSNLYLNLSGGSPNGLAAKANYEYTAGAYDVVFKYTVLTGDDTKGDDISVGSLNLGGAFIRDLAENNLTAFSISSTLSGVKVATTRPAAPVISSIGGETVVNNKAYYTSPLTVSITGIEPNNTLEYKTKSGSDWTLYTGSTSTGNASLTLSLSGDYSIVLRQTDRAATTPNVSFDSSTINVKIDSGAILEQITSTNSNGYYSQEVTGKDVINITLKFRIPVTISDMTLKLNVLGNGATVTDTVTASVTNSKECSFIYDIPPNAYTQAKLNVDSISFTGGSITDGITDISSIVQANFTALKNAGENNLAGQKDIVILTGRSKVVNQALTGDISFTNNGQQLSFKFDREIFRGGATDKFVIIQQATGYRIPAVMSEETWSQIFNNRADIFTDYSSGKFPTSFIDIPSGTITDAARWKLVGEYLYQKGSNGATVTAGTNEAPTTVTSDTTVKYVLRYDVDTTADDTQQYVVPINNTTNFDVTMGQIKEFFRVAEALTFSPSDPAISFSNSNTTLVFNLSGSRKLPVLGAVYDWSFPNSFVKDYLEKGNGSDSVTGRDSGHISTNTTRLSHNSGVESPVIRINKGDDTVDYGESTGNDRQARQPLTSQVKVESRTPSATVSSETRQVNDNVTQLLLRGSTTGANPAVGANGASTTETATDSTMQYYVNRLPNLGTQKQTTAGRTSFEATKMRPQSGIAGSSHTGATLGLNYYSATMPTNWTNQANNPFTIGDANYMLGGMVIQIRARAALSGANSAYTYETAYRSVFVYNNSTVPSSTAAGTGAATANPVGPAVGGGLKRVFVRGGDSPDGDPTTPNFPIARNGHLWKKVKLLTPIDPGTLPNTNTNILAYSRTNTDIIVADRALWFWVTWNINVPAYLDVHFGELSTTDTTIGAPGGNIEYLYMAWVPSKEHYALFPGRTTIVETRAVYSYVWTGSIGGLSKTDASAPLTRED